MATRIKKAFTAVPASISSAVTFLMSIGNKQREINTINSETKEAIKKLQEAASAKIAALVKERDTFFTSLFAFASANKSELTKITRSQKTTAGTFGWRWTTPYVAINQNLDDQAIIKILEQDPSLLQYVRTVKEIDREALLRDRPTVPGLSYEQRDEFFAKPRLAKSEGSAVEMTRTEAIDK